MFSGLYWRCWKRYKSVKSLETGPNQKVPRKNPNCTKRPPREHIRSKNKLVQTWHQNFIIFCLIWYNAKYINTYWNESRLIAPGGRIFQKKVMHYRLHRGQRMPTKRLEERKKMLQASFKVPKLSVKKPEICP